MLKILAIALNTWREAIRNRILYIFLFFALALMILSGVVSTLSIGEHEKIMRDLGLGGISVFGLLIALFVGIGLVYNDIERKTLYTIVSKPIDRKHFILGKFFGLLGTIYTVAFLMTIFFFCTLHFRHYTGDEVMTRKIGYRASTQEQVQYFGNSLAWAFRDSCVSFLGPFVAVEIERPVPQAPNPDSDRPQETKWETEPKHQVFFPLTTIQERGPNDREVETQAEYLHGVFMRTDGLIVAIMLLWVEFALIVAFAVLFSCFSTPFLSFFFTTVVFVIGRLNIDIMRFVDFLTRRTPFEELTIAGKVSYYFAHLAAAVSPNLTYFNQRYELIYEGALPGLSYIGQGVAYGIAYTTLVLLLAIFIFKRRNFK